MKPAADAKGNPLGTAPLGPLIRQFAVPSIVALLVGSVYNITDQIFIGRVVGMLGNAATNVCFPLVSFSIALALLSGIGMAAGFNLSLGAGREEEARRYVCTGLALVALLGLSFAVFTGLCRQPLLRFCGATDNALPYAMEYLSIMVFGMPFHIFTNGVYPIIRADRSPKVAMQSSLVGAVLNVILDWIFLYPLGMGIRGAGAATVISQVVSCAVCVAYFPKFKAFPLKLTRLTFRVRYAGKIMKLGVANFSNHLVMTIVNIVLNNTLTYYGALSVYGSDIPLAVAGIVSKANAIMVSFVVGLAHGCQPILSFNMGAKNYRRVKETYLRGLVIGMLFSICAFVLFQLFPREIISIFGSGDPKYFEFGESYLRVYMFLVCLMGIQPLSTNYFTSIGEVKQGLILSVSRQGFLLLPLLLILPLFFGLDGVLFAGPIADFLAMVLAAGLVFRSFKRLTAREAAEAVAKREPDPALDA
ncbi:MAG: MATE family efflux transporter [Ruminiclostridium sp.]|nr:MATE family efflux transporter [Ruminiclostridium sp.]